MLNPTHKIDKRTKSKKHAQNYINATGEPRDHLSHDTLAKDEAILTGDMPAMKRRFRLIAKNFRIIRINKKAEQ